MLLGLITKFLVFWYIPLPLSSKYTESSLTFAYANPAFSSVAQSCPTLYNPMDCSIPGFPVLHQFPELAQTHVPQVSDAIQPSYSHFPAIISQHQGPFQWVSSSHQVAKVLELQLSISPSDKYSGLISFRWTGLILQSKGLSRVFSNTTVHHFWIQLVV